MDNFNFIKRNKCDICGKENGLDNRLSIAYEDQKVCDVLVNRYCGNISREDLEGVRYELMYCSDCHHLFQNYIPSEKFSNKIYSYSKDRIKESIEKVIKAPVSFYFNNVLAVEKMTALLGFDITPGNKIILDFGMGWGSFLIMAQSFGYQTFGVDISIERRDFVKKFGVNCVENLSSFDNKKFDFIYCSDTLEHIGDPLGYIKTMTKYLSNSGYVFVSVPNGIHILNEKKYDFSFRKIIYPLEHINCFSHKSLVLLANQAGLKTVSPFKVMVAFLKGFLKTLNLNLLFAGIFYLYRYKKSTDLYFEFNNK